MEFVRGCTLATLAGGHALSPELAVALVVQLLEGLAHAHGAGVLHRDVKSENALVTGEGVLKLADFGLSRSEFEAGTTQLGMIMGTPAYMSPEQARGLVVDGRSDLYSAAVVLFELSAGRLPFISGSAMDVLAMQIREVPPSLGQVARAVPKAVAEAVAKGLAKQPEERFATAQAFAACLREAIGEQRLERAVARLPALVERAGAGAQVVAGATFLGNDDQAATDEKAVATHTSPSGRRPRANATVPGGTATDPKRTETPEQSESAAPRERTSQRTVAASGRVQAANSRTVAAAAGKKPQPVPSRSPLPLAAGAALASILLVVVWWTGRAALDSPPAPEPGVLPQARRVLPVAPPPSTGTVRIASRPPGAKIRGQDNSDTHQVTPAVFTNQWPGKCTFKLELAGYLPTMVSTAAVAGRTQTIEVALSPELEAMPKNAAGYEEVKNVKDGTVLISIPGGSFEMGANDGEPDEKPVHRATLSPYFIGKYEVTWKQYLLFCKQAPHPRPAQMLIEAPPSEDHPVTYVSWFDAEAYCKWAGLKMPTEAQWEFAARGKLGLRYPWGNEAPDANGVYRANGAGAADGFAETAPVGSFGPDARPPRTDGSSPFGVLDMAGNVWEWCQDWKGDYPEKPVMDPHGPDHGSCRVIRGGSWDGNAPYLRAATRDELTPVYAIDILGFRCAR